MSVVLSAGLLAMLCAATLTGVARRYALRAGILDVPNARSSHDRVVPRGGGIAIAVTICGALPIIMLTGINDDVGGATPLLPAALPACAVLALLGWVDDHRDLSPALRLAMQLLVGAGVVLYFADEHWPWWLMTPGMVAFAWLVNLYNFMDGTDGIAATQALLAGSFLAAVFLMAGLDGAALAAAVTAGAGAGFLFWNRPPALIFMGDAGSYVLGAMFGVLLVAGAAGVGTVWLVTLLIGAFIVDATLTLLARLLRGERLHEAHRQHAYQRLVQRGWTHRQVLRGFVLVNLLWCWPLAALGLAEPRLAAASTALGYTGLGGLWLAAQRHCLAASPGA